MGSAVAPCWAILCRAHRVNGRRSILTEPAWRAIAVNIGDPVGATVQRGGGGGVYKALAGTKRSLFTARIKSTAAPSSLQRGIGSGRGEQ